MPSLLASPNFATKQPTMTTTIGPIADTNNSFGFNFFCNRKRTIKISDVRFVLNNTMSVLNLNSKILYRGKYMVLTYHISGDLEKHEEYYTDDKALPIKLN